MSCSCPNGGRNGHDLDCDEYQFRGFRERPSILLPSQPLPADPLAEIGVKAHSPVTAPRGDKICGLCMIPVRFCGHF